jgi:Zn-dependent protease with chaperone function
LTSRVASGYKRRQALQAASSEPAPRPADADGGSGSSAQQVRVSSQGSADDAKRIATATYEADLDCRRVVAPFDLSSNADALAKLGTAGAGQMLSTRLGNLLSDFLPSAGATGERELRHKIAYDAREAAVRMNWLPMAAEVWYGRQLLDKMRDQLVVREGAKGKNRAVYESADKLLAEVVAAIPEPHDYRFEIFVNAVSNQNARALPGGIVVVDQDLLVEGDLRDKARFALAHEIAHVLQRHETRAVQARIIDTVSLRGTLANLVDGIGGGVEGIKPLLKLVLDGKLQFERHHVDQELVSDSCAVRLLSSWLKDSAQVDRAVNAFLARLVVDADEPAQASGNDLVELVSRPVDRHPSPEARHAHLKRLLARTSGDGAARPGAGALPPKASKAPAAAVGKEVIQVKKPRTAK